MDAMVLTTARRRPLRTSIAALSGLAIALSGLLGGSIAYAEDTTTPPSAPGPSTSAPPLAPTVEIDSPSDGDFVGSASITVNGTRSADVGIRLSSAGTLLCELPAGTDPTWSCGAIALESGEDVVVTAEAIVDGVAVASFERTVSVLRPPTITGGATNANVSNGVIRGTGFPGASVTATLDTGDSCGFSVDSSGAWSCLLPAGIPSGSYTVTATQSASFAGGVRSDASTTELRIDSERPSAPNMVLASGTARAGDGVFLSGSGEAGASVTVFSGASSLCTTTVTRSGWGCTVILGAGTHELRAVQQDAAGNVSEASSIATLAVAAAPIAPAPKPSEAVPPIVPPSASAAPIAPPSPTAAANPDSGLGTGPRPAAGWNDSTNFAGVISVSGSDPWLWLRSLMIALGGLVLLAIPVRLLANALGPERNARLRGLLGRLAGRNRAHTEFEVAPTLRVRPWAIGAAVVAAASGFAVLARPIDSQPAYLRLLLGVAIAFTVLNVVVVAVGMLVARVRWREAVQPVITPQLLFLVAAATLLSRLLELNPPLLFGIVAGVGLAAGSSERLAAIVDSGALASTRIVTLILLGGGAWFALGMIPSGTGFFTALLADTLGTLALAGLGSATVLLIPLGTLDGRVILARSPLVWVTLTVLAGTFLAAALTPSIDLGTGVVTLTTAVIAVLFGASCMVIWVWKRFAAPRLR